MSASRAIFILGLVVSVAVHVWLLMLPGQPATMQAVPPMVIPIVETELAQVDEPETTVAQADQTPAPEPEPEPEPEPQEAPQPPQPDLVKVAETPEAESMPQGDFAGEETGNKTPLLRIDWGTGDEALATLEAGEMIVVVLDGTGPQPLITQQVVFEDGDWQRRAYQPAGMKQYSNRLRIVEHVPAFDGVHRAAALGGDEHLAVLLPMRVERVLESAQMEAAYHRGLAMTQIDNFAGRFALRDGRLDFDITHVRENARSATP